MVMPSLERKASLERKVQYVTEAHVKMTLYMYICVYTDDFIRIINE